MVPMFTTSCVQSDLYDLYEEDGWFFPRNKKDKEISYQTYIKACEFVASSSWNEGCNECWAASLYYYCNANDVSGFDTPYKVREAISKKVYGDIIIWPVCYKNAVCSGGINTDDSKEDLIMSQIAGITRHQNPKPNVQESKKSKMIAGIDGNHFALILDYIETPIADKWEVRQQDGTTIWINKNRVDSYWY